VELSEFDYNLPKELIAQEPLADRGSSRLMVLEGADIRHRMFSDLPEYLRKGDVLVLNDSLVIPARLRGKRETGGSVELLLLGAGGDTVEALVRSKPLKEGQRILLPGGRCEVEKRIAGSRYRIHFSVPGGLASYLDNYGEMPTPPYIKKRLEKQDRYQTVFAREPGSVAAPTAGLHFTPKMLSRLELMGVKVAFITLHIGPATFQPIKELVVEKHRMEPEYFLVPEATAKAVNERKGRIVAVGTTVVKALESAMANPFGGGPLAAAEGWSEQFIYPGYDFRQRPDMMLTNFHLPRSTLIMLVSALVGRARLLGAYEEAVRERYRFYSFGDSMLCSR
jgi:S-adenosylmethionine:tRNA ribosyltransferase-isomerase